MFKLIKMPQTSEIHHPIQQFNIMWQCATYFILHQLSSCTFLPQQFKKPKYILACRCAVHEMILAI